MDAHGNQLRSSTLTVLPESSGTKNTYNNPLESFPNCHNACHIRKVTTDMIAMSTSFDVYKPPTASLLSIDSIDILGQDLGDIWSSKNPQFSSLAISPTDLRSPIPFWKQPPGQGKRQGKMSSWPGNYCRYRVS